VVPGWVTVAKVGVGSLTVAVVGVGLAADAIDVGRSAAVGEVGCSPSAVLEGGLGLSKVLEARLRVVSGAVGKARSAGVMVSGNSSVSASEA
jgi:hypothetical protein